MELGGAEVPHAELSGARLWETGDLSIPVLSEEERGSQRELSSPPQFTVQGQEQEGDSTTVLTSG